MPTFLDATSPSPATPPAGATPRSSDGPHTFLDAANAPAASQSNASSSSGGDRVRTFLHAVEDRTAPVTTKAGEVLTRLGVPRVIDIMSRPGKAGAAFFAGDEPGEIAHAFASGDPEQYAGDIDRVKQHLGLKHGGPEEMRFGAPVLDTDQLPPIGRGLVDFGLQTLTDPTTFVGGDVARGIGGAAGAAARASGRAIAKTATGRDALDIAQHVGDYFTFGGAAKRTLGSDRYHGAIAADNRQAAREEEAARRLRERYNAIVAPLTEDEKRTVYRVQNGEAQLTDPASGRLIVPQHVADASHALRRLGMDAAAMNANTSGLRYLGYNKAGLRRSADIRGVVKPGEFASPAESGLGLRREESDFDSAFSGKGTKRFTYYDGDQRVGIAEFTLPENGVPHVEFLHTSLGKRGQGVAQTMLRDVTDHLRSLGYDRVSAEPINAEAEAVNARVWGKPLESIDDAKEGMTRQTFALPARAPLGPPSPVLTQTEPWERSFQRPPFADRTRAGVRAAEARGQLDHADATVPASAPRRIVGRIDRPYVLPPELAEFAAPADQGILGRLNIRRHYLPGPREVKPVDPKVRPQPFNLLRPFAPNLIQRDEISVGEAGEDLAPFDAAWEGMLANAARQGTAGRLRAEVGAPLDLHAANREPTALEQLFEVTPRATGAARNKTEKASDLARGALDLPKNAITGFGLKHGLVNVPTLAALSEGPGAALEALVRGAQLARKNPADRYAALQDAIEGGVISPFSDRSNTLVDAVSKVPIFGKPIGALGRGANNLTWAIDDAAKAAVLRRKLARGMSPSEAAGQALRELIDYKHRSSATRHLSNVAPFATFRSRLPAAVASSAARNPARILALDRATQGLASNGRVDENGPNGNRRTIGDGNPLSDVLQIGDEPQRYARATLGDPLRALLSPIGMQSRYYKRADGKMHERLAPGYFTYGEPLLPHRDKDGHLKAGFLALQAAGYLPFGVGDALLKATGTNELPADDWLSTLLGGVLGVHVR